MTDEYLQKKWEEIEKRMKRFEKTASHNDKMILHYMVRDWESKMRFKLKNETVQGKVPPSQG